MLGLYSGAYMFPMIAPEPCPGLTPEEKKLIAELHEMIYAEYSDNLFKKPCNDDIDAYINDNDVLDELKSHEETWYEYTRKDNDA
jgi:DNA replication initiation complex subunit (GINS family)